MIEISRDALLQTFFEQADHFVQDPNVLNGTAFDDTVVKLKCLLYSTQPDSAVIGRLNGLARLIRDKDTDSIADHAQALRQSLQTDAS